MTEGQASAWSPYWKNCQPCQAESQYDYILEVGPHIQDEKSWLFNHLKMNSSVELVQSSQTQAHNPQTLETKRRYFGQLSKQEIFDLYNLYRLDHELFGYDPQEYIDMGTDDKEAKP